MFKNETHNHPTEIELPEVPQLVWAAIRDPLPGDLMFIKPRVTGAGDPTVPVSDTLPGKLSQKKLSNRCGGLQFIR